jgi:hypothetical protein
MKRRDTRRLKMYWGGSALWGWRTFRSFVYNVVVSTAIIGCASVTATRTNEGDYKTEGLRYWLPMPYLLVREPLISSQVDSFYKVDVGKNEWTPIAPVSGLGRDPLAMPAGSPPNGNGQGKKDGEGEGKKEEGAAQPPATTPPPPVEIIYLPDYCHQYSLQMTSILATLNADVTFGDGWKLMGLNSKADSTALLSKVLDVVAAIKTGAAPTAQEPEEAEEEDTKIKKLLTEVPAGEAVHLYVKKSVVRRLKPGIYPIFTRGPAVGLFQPEDQVPVLNTCNAVPTISFSADSILGGEEVSYSVIKVITSKTSGAGPPKK